MEWLCIGYITIMYNHNILRVQSEGREIVTKPPSKGEGDIPIATWFCSGQLIMVMLSCVMATYNQEMA